MKRPQHFHSYARKTFRRLLMASSLAACLLLGATACSSDDEEETQEEIPEAAVTFTLSGQLEGEKSGRASVFQSEVDSIFRLNFHFTDGEGDTDGSFFLDFDQGPSSEPISFPVPGTYSLGGIDGTGDFRATFTDLNSNVIYLGETMGAMVIDRSDDYGIEGSFTLSTALITNPDNQITLSDGRFWAEIIP